MPQNQIIIKIPFPGLIKGLPQSRGLMLFCWLFFLQFTSSRPGRNGRCRRKKTMASSWVLCTKHNAENSCLTFWKLWQLLGPTALLSEPHRVNNSQQYYLKLLKVFKFPDYLWKASTTYFGSHPTHLGYFFIKGQKDHLCSEGFSHFYFSQQITKLNIKHFRRTLPDGYAMVWRTREICNWFWPVELPRQAVHFSSALLLSYLLALWSLYAKG